LLLLDEPYTGLDILSQAAIRAAVEHQRALGKTVVMSTHDIADATTADRVVLLAGRIVAAGKPESALTDVNLSAAYGGRVVHVGDGRILLDDPHHPSHGEQYHR
jgi:ABC-type Mn2+/Zn2+ transport system ATPase subunit